jgi:hypothetical protein
MPSVPNYTLVTQGVRSGLSRNDGTKGFGTATNPIQVAINDVTGPTTNIDIIPTQEADDSPTIERAEQCTVRHVYKGSYNNCLALLAIYGRGVLITDDFGNYYRVQSSGVQYQKPGRGILTITSLSISFDVPPDEVSWNSVKLGLDILKHPRYFYALMPQNQIPGMTVTETPSQTNAKQTIIRAIQAYRENPYIPTTANINGMVGLLHDNTMANLASGQFPILKPNPNYRAKYPATDTLPIQNPPSYPAVPTNDAPSPNPVSYWDFVSASSDPGGLVALALAAAKEIIGKLWRMEDSPPVSGIELTWSEYSFTPPLINLGGYVEDPKLASPGLPDYYYLTQQNSTQTIFDGLSYFNPQCYSATGQYGGGTNISWLRDSDVLESLQNVLWKITRKWLGAPVGAWDADINGAQYSNGNRPTLPSHYRNLILS